MAGFQTADEMWILAVRYDPELLESIERWRRRKRWNGRCISSPGCDSGNGDNKEPEVEAIEGGLSERDADVDESGEDEMGGAREEESRRIASGLFL